jgi:transposase
MTDQQQHLAQVLEQQQTILAEINELNTQVDNKRQLAIKLQGVREYLEQLGVELPQEDETVAEEPSDAPTTETEVVD